MGILHHFPYDTPRQGQAELLLALEKHWNSADVFVIVAPTAFGKSACMRTIQQWQHSVSAITPTNMLVDQFLEEFPESPTLHRLDSYHCEKWDSSCASTRGRQKAFCKGCKCSSDLATARYRKGPGIYNYYTYLAHRLERQALVVDEAHNLVSTIRDRLSETIWLHDYPQLSGAVSVASVGPRLAKLTTKQKRHKKILLLEEAVTATAPKYVVEFGEEWFNGKGTKRGDPELRRCIKLLPVDIGESIGMFLMQDTKKLILLSATIGHVDITELGLQHKKVLYLNAEHPITPEHRPVQLLNTAALSHGNMEQCVPALVREIEAIAAYHKGEKGVVHVTYRLASLLAPHLGGRFIFHDQGNKREMYEYFRESDPAEGRVLVACGMYEGIDLPDDLGRWQVIAKTPWKSLGDPAIKYKAEQDPDWYLWRTCIDLIQACGRICRHEEDYGITYILDSTATRLIEQAEHLIPRWFKDAIYE